MTTAISLLLLLVAVAVLVGAWRLARAPAGRGERVLTQQEIRSLVALGFFDHVPAAERDAVQAEIARTTWPFWVERTRRFIHTDAEDLAEGGVARFVDELRPFLRDRSAEPGHITDTWDTDYRVTCDGHEVLIWSADEAARERDDERPGLVWGLATARAFGLVNRILQKAGSRERLYAVGGGNDLLAYFLTPELAELVSRLPGTDESDKPYLPDEAYPWFGQPHP